MRQDKTCPGSYESEIGLKLYILPKCPVQGHGAGTEQGSDLTHFPLFPRHSSWTHIQVPAELMDLALNHLMGRMNFVFLISCIVVIN